MGGSEKSPTARSDSDPSRSVTVISSSDEEGTNKDLIVERHLKRERSEAVDVAFKEEESVGTTDSAITSVNEMPDNAVLRKLLRGPRYFDPGNRDSGACFNCGEEGHPATDCTVKRKEKRRNHVLSVGRLATMLSIVCRKYSAMFARTMDTFVVSTLLIVVQEISPVTIVPKPVTLVKDV
ncbi:uncharacterized protein LOC109842014 [Asparagus officinalis]|uniref:uncharacterized protein LOC109842014 n=1 Tax=Asparagus officinalis TaxID=4686 RepID=UPI00098E45B2|nr:uncharacterized protein LOC109842014 [Asparagus officinalis]